MEVDFLIECSACGSKQPARIALRGDSFEYSCSECGEHHFVAAAEADWSVGRRLGAKAANALLADDYSLAIVFAAMAIDCELSRLFIRWFSVECAREGREFSESHAEKQLRRVGGSFHRKVKQVMELTYSDGFDAFVARSSELSAIRAGFPSLVADPLTDQIHAHVIKPRNRILHFADTSYGIQDATRATNIAQFALTCLLRIDQDRIRTSLYDDLSRVKKKKGPLI